MGVSTDHTHDAHTGPASQGDLQSGMVAGQRRLKDRHALGPWVRAGCAVDLSTFGGGRVAVPTVHSASAGGSAFTCGSPVRPPRGRGSAGNQCASAPPRSASGPAGGLRPPHSLQGFLRRRAAVLPRVPAAWPGRGGLRVPVLSRRVPAPWRAGRRGCARGGRGVGDARGRARARAGGAAGPRGRRLQWRGRRGPR
ncbi:uncharacterized protein LOC116570091 isoform X2 [Mustela erminea]|uniref:uncharacterized protein LOC116570091 isoform X2 n=1 Tax=Mustela erminea TaxID=36723 RepID=UPI00138735AB|nr:uncharacterized protein LOC116570091 isoform X2 [Mustela erminea]